MAINQKYRGDGTKQYAVLANFNKGLDLNTADDVASEESFVELTNFFSANEGNLSKRYGIYNSNFSEFIERIINEEYAEGFNIVTNDLGETKATCITNLTKFYNQIIKGQESVQATIDGTKIRTFKMNSIIGVQTIRNNKFLECLNFYDTILEGGYLSTVSAEFNFKCLIVAGGISHGGTYDTASKYAFGLSITRLGFDIVWDIVNERYEVKIEVDHVDPSDQLPTSITKGGSTYSLNDEKRWLYKPEKGIIIPESGSTDMIVQPPIDIANYNGKSYIATGNGYIIEVEQLPSVKTTNEYNEPSTIKTIGNQFGIAKLDEGLYAPTSLETSYIGFNIASSDPLNCVTNTGSAVKVKGVFYTIEVTKDGTTYEQPVVELPYNKPFKIHMFYTGSTAPSATIQYRQNNGETDTSKNPYQNLSGSWTSTSPVGIWTCSEGINSELSYEIKITLGTDTFITYVNTTSKQPDETGLINDIKDTVLKSTRLQVIGNQLVLYGNHGYMFFSEYETFNFFPNYNYIYVANEVGEEEVVSINYFRQYYAIFTNKRIKKMVGTFGADDFGVYPLNDYIGCANRFTVKAYGSNLFFLGNDGIYQLKQGYLGEGTENVEKIDIRLNNELNLSNVSQAFMLNGNYIIVMNTNNNNIDAQYWVVYNTELGSFYHYTLEPEVAPLYRGQLPDIMVGATAIPFCSIFQAEMHDANGDFLIIPMYNYTFSEHYESASFDMTKFMLFRFTDTSYGLNERKDGAGFISSLTTHNMSLGYPTHTKKFKDIFIKMLNDSGEAIPLYITVAVDDKIIIDPTHYEVVYDGSTNTYYYVLKNEANKELITSQALGEFTLAKDILGNKTVQQIKMRIGKAGRSIRIGLADGANDTTALGTEGVGQPIRKRNTNDFSIESIGIVYKVKKVKEG